MNTQCEIMQKNVGFVSSTRGLREYAPSPALCFYVTLRSRLFFAHNVLRHSEQFDAIESIDFHNYIMLDKNELVSGFALYAELSDRKIVVKTMLSSPEKTIMKIPLTFPLWNGMIFVEISKVLRCLKIWHQPIISLFFRKTMLDQIEMDEFENMDSAINAICDRIERYYCVKNKT